MTKVKPPSTSKTNGVIPPLNKEYIQRKIRNESNKIDINRPHVPITNINNTTDNISGNMLKITKNFFPLFDFFG
jgi:hypothetical protein